MTESSTVNPADEESLHCSDHVLLFMQENENRELLQKWLHSKYTVSVGSTPSHLDQQFDLCIVDETMFSRHSEALIERQERAAPVFLPYLLVIDDRSVSAIDQRVWEYVDEVVATPVKQAELNGRLTGLLARRTLSKALASQKERMLQILRTVPDPLIVVNEEGQVIEANPALEDHTGCNIDTITGSPLDAMDAFPPETVDMLTQLADSESAVNNSSSHPNQTDNSESTTSEQASVIYRHTDGTIRTAEVGAAPLTSVGESEFQILFIFRDVTERIARERTLERERDRLDDFADMLAHEIRNPLNIAQGYLGRLTPHGERDETTMEQVATAHTRMEQMIKELLAHARGELLGTVQPVDLGRIAEVAWEQMPTAEATLEITTDDATVEADPKTLQTILENLFRNASEHAGRTVTVRIGSLDEGGFYLEDDGPGIAVEDREQVFERGYTTDSAGTGLGLALVRQVAEDHGWKLTATDSELGGVRFEFETSPDSDPCDPPPTTTDEDQC